MKGFLVRHNLPARKGSGGGCRCPWLPGCVYTKQIVTYEYWQEHHGAEVSSKQEGRHQKSQVSLLWGEVTSLTCNLTAQSWGSPAYSQLREAALSVHGGGQKGGCPHLLSSRKSSQTWGPTHIYTDSPLGQGLSTGSGL